MRTRHVAGVTRGVTTSPGMHLARDVGARLPKHALNYTAGGTIDTAVVGQGIGVSVGRQAM